MKRKRVYAIQSRPRPFTKRKTYKRRFTKRRSKASSSRTGGFSNLLGRRRRLRPRLWKQRIISSIYAWPKYSSSGQISGTITTTADLLGKLTVYPALAADVDYTNPFYVTGGGATILHAQSTVIPTFKDKIYIRGATLKMSLASEVDETISYSIWLIKTSRAEDSLRGLLDGDAVNDSWRPWHTEAFNRIFNPKIVYGKDGLLEYKSVSNHSVHIGLTQIGIYDFDPLGLYSDTYHWIIRYRNTVSSAAVVVQQMRSYDVTFSAESN